MADLNVQPKSKSQLWFWFFILLLAGLIVYFLLHKNDHRTAVIADSTAFKGEHTHLLAATQPDWNKVDFNVPSTRYDELKDSLIVVKKNDKYSIYGLGENILFNKDQSTIQPGADAQLYQIASSLHKRFKGANIAVFGSTDATGDPAYNAKLGKYRAIAVKNWLIEKGGFSETHVSVHSLGENKPIATNLTAHGKQQNRNVQIVVFNNPK
ncbi:OmpA family protein [Pedobacter sp. L105]|uniref:OmpA family protein n=1 Tax=Pedobacter sp. L105 TaxID=1641871 RepID=UPI00131C7CAE|nr:OmpA family protein [Pedobacter sp. L105]